MLNKKFNLLVSVFLVCILIFSAAFLTGCATQATVGDSDEDNVSEAERTTREITDDAGRTITIPKDINKVYSPTPVATILIYTLAPEKLAGWNFELWPANAKYILPELHDLPVLGGWYGNNTGNIEEILKVNPDVIISLVDSINETNISTADKIQDQLGIPVIVVRMSPISMDEAYEFIGELLGAEERAARLASYFRDTIEDIQRKAAEIPENEKINVYHAQGAEGLQTEPSGSEHIQTLELVGGLNAAGEVAPGESINRVSVSLEQVLDWDPDVIICWDELSGGAYKIITTDSRWAELQAVQKGQVYEIPSTPFEWFARPPSVNRIIGFKWLGNLLYPDVYQYDIIKEVREFYQLFYHYDLTVEEAEKLLVNSRR